MTRRIESYPSPGALSPRLALLAIFFFAAFYAYPATVTVNVVEFTFNPRVVNINQGDTIQWTGGNGTHTVTSGASPFSADGLFNGTEAIFNPTFSYTFNDAATFPYFCSPHYLSNNMVGTVNVAAVQVEVLDPANVYVNTAHNGSEIGTENNPIKTIVAAIEAAVNAADPNPTIHIAPGTYTETFTEANTASLPSAMKLQVNGSGTVSIGATLPFSISGFHTRTTPLKITDDSKE